MSTAERIVLNSDVLSATVYPQHGGLISALVVNVSGANLLWERMPPRLQRFDGTSDAHRSANSFDEDVFSGGWFAMFPLAGIPGPSDSQLMHGELSRKPWMVDQITASSVVLSVKTSNPQFQVSRQIRVVGNQISVTTTARNMSGADANVTFGEHPCLARSAFAGGEIRINATAAHVPSGVSDARAITYQPGHHFSWPLARKLDGSQVEVSQIPLLADGRHDHISIALRTGEFSVSAPALDGVLTFSVDVEELPHVLFWQHYQPAQSPWNGDVLALEAASASGRTMDEARNSHQVTHIRPNGSLSWRMSARWDAGLRAPAASRARHSHSSR